jgi:hypothetical protein
MEIVYILTGEALAPAAQVRGAHPEARDPDVGLPPPCCRRPRLLRRKHHIFSACQASLSASCFSRAC